MEKILDSDYEKAINRSSWKPVLITNGVFSIIFISFIYCMFLLVDDTGFSSTAEMISAIFTMLFLCIIAMNILLLFISLFFSKIYWKKWLIMAIFGVVLLTFIIVVVFTFHIGSIRDID